MPFISWMSSTYLFQTFSLLKYSLDHDTSCFFYSELLLREILQSFQIFHLYLTPSTRIILFPFAQPRSLKLQNNPLHPHRHSFLSQTLQSESQIFFRLYKTFKLHS